MASLPSFILLTLMILIPSSSPASISTQSLHPPSTFTTLSFVENSGAFLTSPSSTFIASFSSLPHQPSLFYLTLIHSPSTSLLWSANPNTPLPSSSSLNLSSSSLSLSFPNGSLAWSTPPLTSPIHSLHLLDSGNLVLLDSSNSSLWQSFQHPTDTLLPGQKLRTGSFLASPVSDADLSDGGYRLFVTASDAVLSWRESQQYWSLSTDPKSFKDYSSQVAYMELNGTGLYLLDAVDRVVYQLPLPLAAGFRVAQMSYDGTFRIVNYGSGSGSASDDFVAPSDGCGLPFACKSLGLCPSWSNGSASACTCPDSFVVDSGGGCSPIDGYVLASSSSSSSCGGDGDGGSSSSIEYLSLGSKISYFANKFATPISGNGFPSCQAACSMNCSCLGFFYRNSSMSCYLVQNQIGTLIYTEYNISTIGYIKTLKSPSPSSLSNTNGKSSTNILPILLPVIATLLLLLVVSFVGFQWWRKRRGKKRGSLVSMKLPMREIKLGEPNSFVEDELSDSEEILIPGLPTRFTYADLAAATRNFETLIGSGGFGSVYKGELRDKSFIAVKRITNIGIQGKREFCTEIAVIGEIHHVNLVKLRGFCAQGSDRMLVYEYMNRGSLEKPLFGQGPALEWQERLEIAIGAARGIAYLHTGCDHKILHCDIKPENILLADHGQVKIADFGMAKLMSPEQSGLFTTMRGTRGYLAPEWLTNSAISDKTDVYSYGMVLLEIVRGRKNRCTSTGGSSIDTVSSSGSSGDYFPMIALEKHVEGKWLELADPRMEGRVSESEVKKAVKVALCCLHEEPWMRPSMASVVAMLEGTMAVSEPKVEGLKFLRLYGRGPNVEAEMVVVGSGNFTGTDISTANTSLLTVISSQEVSGPR